MARLRFMWKVIGTAAAVTLAFGVACCWLHPGWRVVLLDDVTAGALVVLAGTAWMLDALMRDPYTHDHVVRRLADAVLGGGRTSLRVTRPHHVQR